MYKLYSQENCPNCDELKSFLKNSKIDFEELDVNTNPKARAFMLMNDIETTPALEINENILCGTADEIAIKIKELL